MPRAQLADQVLHQWPVPGILQPDALGDRRWHQPRIPDRRQRDEVHPVWVLRGHLRGQRDAQPGLAAAARPGQRDQVAAPEQPFRLRQLVFPADKAGQRLRQAAAAGSGFDGAAGWRDHRTPRDVRHATSALPARCTRRHRRWPPVTCHADRKTNHAAPQRHGPGARIRHPQAAAGGNREGNGLRGVDMSSGAARAMQAPGRPARGRAECPDLGGQRLDRNRADGLAERRFVRFMPLTLGHVATRPHLCR